MRSRARGALLMVALFAPGARAAVPAPYLSPWVAVSPGSARIEALKSRAPAELSPNAPGLLLEVDSFEGGSEGEIALESARTLVPNARRAGWRTGLSLTLPKTSIPEDARAA